MQFISNLAETLTVNILLLTIELFYSLVTIFSAHINFLYVLVTKSMCNGACIHA